METPTITISAETPLQDDIRVLVRELNDYMIPLTPREFQFQMTVEQMAEPAVTLFVARDETGRALGMGALKQHDDSLGEVKRMYTLPQLRGKRLGSMLLGHIEALARSKGLTLLALETGEAPGFEPAWRLYERNGFTTRGAFHDYPDSGFSRFYEKKLT
ncbi:MAG: GNAT family N-acetyltransferase [Nitratireductor sp.]|nr:GNAT family N-acetyltransferase [Nitratireductor sp.]